MIDNNKIKKFRKTDATLVYIASPEYAKKIMGEKYHSNLLYIHVEREGGSVTAYEGNDTSKLVQLNSEERDYILKHAEDER